MINPYSSDPHWHGYIIWYFFLGGIAAGTQIIASLAELFGDRSDRDATRRADFLALPLLIVCGVLLVLDLGRPERFWHMLIQSETGRPMFKWWSPMSVGAWALAVFGACVSIRWLRVAFLDRSPACPRWIQALIKGRSLNIVGAFASFFLGSYTGVLLSATNEPIWSQSDWIAPLFLSSSVTTGAATLILANRLPTNPSEERASNSLKRLDRFVIGLEAILLAGFLLSLGRSAERALVTLPGLLIPAAVVPLGIVVPLIPSKIWPPRLRRLPELATIAGGLALRTAVVGMPLGYLIEKTS